MGNKKQTTREVASAARTTSASSDPIDLERADDLLALLDVTAESGTSPTLDVDFEISLDGGNTWTPLFSFLQATGQTRELVSRGSPIGSMGRFTWAIGGTTPSFTFSIDLERSLD